LCDNRTSKKVTGYAEVMYFNMKLHCGGCAYMFAIPFESDKQLYAVDVYIKNEI
jgi:hypothetical protein